MNASRNLVAIDLGADSGRLMLGRLDDDRLDLREMHRFSAQPVRLPGRLFTDLPRIWSEILEGLARTRRAGAESVEGLGVDTWGVDFALLDEQAELLSLPYHYRDELSTGMDELVFRSTPAREVFATTGNQLMPINSLYQLVGLLQKRPSLLGTARHLLFMPDLLTFWLGGDRQTDRTIASTSQCYDPVARDWAVSLLARQGIPRHLFGSLREPASIVGELSGEVRSATGLGGARVLAPGGHDTALAVAAVPAKNAGFAYVSVGTWSLLGTELDAPQLGDEAYRAGFTNEVGVFGTTRFLKNLCGLWPLQECRRVWARAGKEYSFAELVALAEAAPRWTAVLDLDAPYFAQPGEMPARVAAYCAATHQPPPQGVGWVVRVILESLALKYRRTLGTLEQLTAARPGALHLVGGGCKNRLLCQLVADAIGREVLAGPAEATATGNLLLQAAALGWLDTLGDVREVVRRSCDVAAYEPSRHAAIDGLSARLRDLLGAPLHLETP